MTSGPQELVRQLEECKKELEYYKREYVRAKDNATSERKSKNEILTKYKELEK